MTDLTYISNAAVNACNCTGPKPGEPFCPCKMRAEGIFKRDGKWVRPARGEQVIGEAYDVDPQFLQEQIKF